MSGVEVSKFQLYALRTCIVAFLVAATGFGLGYAGYLQVAWIIIWVSGIANIVSILVFLTLKLNSL